MQEELYSNVFNNLNKYEDTENVIKIAHLDNTLSVDSDDDHIHTDLESLSKSATSTSGLELPPLVLRAQQDSSDLTSKKVKIDNKTNRVVKNENNASNCTISKKDIDIDKLNNKLNRLTRSVKSLKTSKVKPDIVTIENIVPYEGKKIFLPEDTVYHPRNSSYKHVETEGSAPFEWVSYKPEASENKSVSKLDTNDKPEEPFDSNKEIVNSMQEDKLRFPSSFYNLFKAVSGIDWSRAAEYHLDAFTALRDHISVSPPFITEVFHRAGRDDCCNRPPSANSCIRNKRKVENKEILDSLPVFTLSECLSKWFSGNIELENSEPEKVDIKVPPPPSGCSNYYQSDYNEHFAQTFEFPKFGEHEFKYFSFTLFLVVFISTFFGGSMVILPVLTAWFVLFRSRSLSWLYTVLLLLGGFLEQFYILLESILKYLLPSKRFDYPSVKRVRFWFKRNRNKSLVKFYHFLERFSTNFLYHEKFNTGILFHGNLRKLTSILQHKTKFNSRSRRYLANRLIRGRKPLLHLSHLRKDEQLHDKGKITVPMTIRNHVPLIKARLGSKDLNIIIDSGSPCNLIPFSFLQTFEKDTGYRCVRFENGLKLRAHNSSQLNIKDFGVLLPFSFLTLDGNTQEVNLPFHLEDCNSQDIIMGMPQLINFNISVEPKTSSCSLNIHTSYSPLIPLTPIPVHASPEGLKIADDIPLKDGIYHISSFENQTYHEKQCKNQHDPRSNCQGASPKSNVDINRNVEETYNNFVELSNNQGLPTNNESKIRDGSLVANVEYVCRLKRSSSVLRPGIEEKDMLTAEPRNYFDPNLQPVPVKIDVNNEDIQTLCPETVVEIDDESTCDPHRDEDDLRPNASLVISDLRNLIPDSNPTLYLWIVGEGPEFKCKFNNECKCPSVVKKHRIKTTSHKDCRARIIVSSRKNKDKDIFFSLPGTLVPSQSSKITSLVRILSNYRTHNFVMNVPEHCNLPSWRPFLEDLKSGFSTVITSEPKKFRLYCQTSKTQDILPRMNHLFADKQQQFKGSTRTLPSSIITEKEAFPLLSTSTFAEDLKTFLDRSGPSETEFLKLLMTEFQTVASSNPTDMGRIENPDFRMDIILTDPNAKLPLDLPFDTSAHKKVAADKIVEGWLASGIAVHSNVRTHASRLTVAGKHLSDRDFKKIVERLKTEHSLDYSTLDKSEFSRINPSLLTNYEVQKAYRVCLDARSLNAITKAEVTASPNPDVVIAQLMNMSTDTVEHIDHLNLKSKLPETLHRYFENEMSANKENSNDMYYTCLDIRSAHNSIVLTEQSSYYLNVVSPSWKIFRFVCAPFGLKNINSVYNSTLSTLLSHLIALRVVVLYADDVLIVTRSRKLHRLVLAEVFRVFKENKIKLSLNKCDSFVTEFQFLGFRFTPQGIRLTTERMAGISKMLHPHDLKSLQRYLGTLVYLSRFIPDLQSHLLPITKLLNKKIPFSWGREQTEAFDKIKKIILDDGELRYIDGNRELSLYVDSSRRAGGAVLFQKDPKTGEALPVAFFSRKYNEAQTRHFSSLELELINTIDSLARLRCFINQTNKPISLYTDAKSILFLLKSVKEGSNPKLSRLASRLAMYDLNFNISYMPPESDDKFKIADFLSRSREGVGPDNTSLKPPPMSQFRKLDKSHIVHNLEEGKTYTLHDLIEQIDLNPQWFTSFPTPADPYPFNEVVKEDKVVECFSSFQHISSVPALDEVVEPKQLHNLMFLRDDLSPVKIIKEQQSDEYCKNLLNEMEKMPVNAHNHNGFTTKNNILYKMKNINKTVATENLLLVLPKSILPQVIAEFHVGYGHIGRVKLTDILNTMYYAPGLSTKTKLLTDGCHLCQVMKASTSRNPPLVATTMALFPMKCLAMDFFHTTPVHGYRHVLLGVDMFSGFCFTRACKSESSTEVVNFLENIFKTLGAPISLKSDNGSSLIRNKNVRQLLASWGVEEVSLSLPYSPVHNSKAERSVKSMRSLIRSLAPGNITQWFASLDRLTYIHNTTPRTFKNGNEVMLASPFELFLRRKPLPIFPSPALLADETAESLFVKSQEDIQKLEKFVGEYLTKMNLTHIEKMNKNTRPSPIKIGDLVLLKDMAPPAAGRSPKKYHNSYKDTLFIVRFIKDQLAILEDPRTYQTTFQNVRYIKLYKNREAIFQELSPELKNVMGYPFNRLHDKSRQKLIDFMASNELDHPVFDIASDKSDHVTMQSQPELPDLPNKVNSDFNISDEYQQNQLFTKPNTKSISTQHSVPKSLNNSILEPNLTRAARPIESLHDEFAPEMEDELLEVRPRPVGIYEPPKSSHSSSKDSLGHISRQSGTASNKTASKSVANAWRRVTRATSKILGRKN